MNEKGKMKAPRKQSDYNKFVAKEMKGGKTMAEAAFMWRNGKKETKGKVGRVSEYNKFMAEERKKGKTMAEVAIMWRDKKQSI